MHFGKLILINLIYVVLLMLSNLFALYMRTEIELTLMCISLLFTYAVYFLIFFVLGAMMVATSNGVLGRPVSVKNALQRVFAGRIGWKIFLGGLLVGLGVVCGLILFIIPGIYLIIRWSFVTQAIVLEKEGVRDSLKRSGDLVRGNFWLVFFAYIISFAISLIATYGLNYLIIISLGIIGFNFYSAAGAFLIKLTPGVYIGSLVTGPFLFLTNVVLYYSLRARKENYNEELLAVEMGYEPLPETITV